MIRHAKILEIPDILLMTRACAEAMIKNGIYQWNDIYPSHEAFEKDIARNELFVLEIEDKIIGTVVVSTLMDEEYKAVKWLLPTTNHAYIHRLGVHPDHQGKGYARQLMNFAENLSKASNFASVRLDTFSKNIRNQRFYEARGYLKLEDIYFLKQSEYPFHCYELVL